MPHLISVNLSNNGLSGTLPWNLSALADVVILDLALNRVSGPIPSLSGFTDLISFDVDSNQLTGSIPSLSTLTSMTGFFVSNNNLSAAMPLHA